MYLPSVIFALLLSATFLQSSVLGQSSWADSIVKVEVIPDFDNVNGTCSNELINTMTNQSMVWVSNAITSCNNKGPRSYFKNSTARWFYDYDRNRGDRELMEMEEKTGQENGLAPPHRELAGGCAYCIRCCRTTKYCYNVCFGCGDLCGGRRGLRALQSWGGNSCDASYVTSYVQSAARGWAAVNDPTWCLGDPRKIKAYVSTVRQYGW